MTAKTPTWLLLLLASLLAACQGTQPGNLGAREGKLAPCPPSPNCVSSQASDDEHRIAPLAYTGPSNAAIQRLRDIVQSLPRTHIVTGDERYLYAEFTSAFFRFVDDVEFLADDAAKLIHNRSASRVGYGDFGVNRERVELIRTRWQISPALSADIDCADEVFRAEGHGSHLRRLSGQSTAIEQMMRF